MVERRSLTEGLKATPKIDKTVVRDFVYGDKGNGNTHPKTTSPLPVATTSTPNRVPISTRIRDDFAKALKRASLERQLNGTKPDTLQDILEEAIEPWLKANGYLP